MLEGIRQITLENAGWNHAGVIARQHVACQGRSRTTWNCHLWICHSRLHRRPEIAEASSRLRGEINDLPAHSKIDSQPLRDLEIVLNEAAQRELPQSVYNLRHTLHR